MKILSICLEHLILELGEEIVIQSTNIFEEKKVKILRS